MGNTDPARIVRALALVAAVVSIVSLHAGATSFQDHYRLRLKVMTTSDWTVISFENVDAITFLDEIVETSGAEGLSIGTNREIIIYKDSYDASEVTIWVDVGVFELGSMDLAIGIEKGDINETNVALYNWNTQSPTYIDTLTNNVNIPGDGTNHSDYFVDNQAITDGGPRLRPFSSPRRKVLAFYYPWYANPNCSGYWLHWDPDNHYDSWHEPIVGYYDSHDPWVINEHIRWAQECGIDGFIVSWWGAGTFSDESLSLLLPLAELQGFEITVYYETADTRSQVVSDIKYLMDQYSSSPSFVTVDGSPVVFFYSRVVQYFTEADWECIFSTLDAEGYDGFWIGHGFDEKCWNTFDGSHIYSPVSMSIAQAEQQFDLAGLRTVHQGNLFAACTAPGYDDTLIRDPGFVRDRAGGTYYQGMWDAATTKATDWVLVTSFNEWHETTEIEPSVELGDRYLNLTAKKSFNWKGRPSETASLFRVDNTGNVLSDGTFGATDFSTGSADIAEWVTVTEEVEYGDVLAFDINYPESYCLTSTPCSSVVAGVVSSTPGVTLGGGGSNATQALLALVGIVPTKVTNEGGPIQPGDLLIASSTPGHAMCWDGEGTCPCALVGKALEPFDGEKGVIKVLLTAH